MNKGKYSAKKKKKDKGNQLSKKQKAVRAWLRVMEEMGPKANARSSPSCHAIWAKKLAYPGTKQKSYPTKDQKRGKFLYPIQYLQATNPILH